VNGDEHGRGERGVDQSDGQINRSVGGRASIDGDAVFGILVFAGDAFDAAVALVREPRFEDMRREKSSPVALGRHPAPHQSNRQSDAQERERREDQGLVPEALRIAAAQGIEEIAVPVVQPILHRKLGEAHHQQADRQRPGQDSGLATPKARSARPESRQAIAVRVVVVLLGHQPVHSRIAAF
jgi:hypothetical protein